MVDARNYSQVSSVPAEAAPGAKPIAVPPPQQLNWLVECLGADATLTLIETAGGMQIYVPMVVGATNRCSPAAVLETFNSKFGVELAKKLIRYFGGSEIKVPTAQRWRTMLYAKQGMSTNDIAYKLGCSYRTVQQRLFAHRQETQQRGDCLAPRRRVTFSTNDGRSR